MSRHPLISFQPRLQVQGQRPGTQDRYVSILARFLRETDVPAASITADDAYDFLVERGNVLGLSASWFNVTFHVPVAWLEEAAVADGSAWPAPQAGGPDPSPGGSLPPKPGA